ncbi:proteasome assembly chaperone 3-like [Neocloeon triangulifer]|uniref:proteasome assembly chaperone 3-like n=1 Tax=Neocloeon triangulifer TaxID=2078957 RepID=UPI00286F3566|nr:proteasome assembly chaperone 3-like [Neocloeon triangulifer]
MIDDSVSTAAANSLKKEDSSVKLFSAEINNTHTEFAINSYTDRFFIIITQTGNIGTLVSVEKDTAKVEKETAEVYSIRVLLGKDDEDVHIAARFLAGQLNLPKPILFSFCIKDLGLVALKNILQKLKEHLQ